MILSLSRTIRARTNTHTCTHTDRHEHDSCRQNPEMWCKCAAVRILIIQKKNEKYMLKCTPHTKRNIPLPVLPWCSSLRNTPNNSRDSVSFFHRRRRRCYALLCSVLPASIPDAFISERVCIDYVHYVRIICIMQRRLCASHRKSHGLRHSIVSTKFQFNTLGSFSLAPSIFYVAHMQHTRRTPMSRPTKGMVHAILLLPLIFSCFWPWHTRVHYSSA